MNAKKVIIDCDPGIDGLLSDGGVHSHIQHLYALLQMAKNKGLTRVYVHAFLDGRDVSPTSGKDFVSACRDKCQALGVGKIATVMGRYYAMDRDNRWERVQLAYDAMVYGEGIQNPDPVDAVAQSYANDVTDEFMEPVVCDPEGTISDNDSIIFFNYRPDRAREITRAIVCDLHPKYNSTVVAEELGYPVIRVQHHYAHILSCMTENDCHDPVIGVAFDGTGYGTACARYPSLPLISPEKVVERLVPILEFLQPRNAP